MFVYALYNQRNKRIYIGQTSDIQKRLARHNGFLPRKPNAYTKRGEGSWEVIYLEEVENRAMALNRERELKSARGRAFIRTHIRP